MSSPEENPPPKFQVGQRVLTDDGPGTIRWVFANPALKPARPTYTIDLDEPMRRRGAVYYEIELAAIENKD